MNKKEIARRMELSKVLLPLFQASMKNKELNLLNLYEEVDSNVHKIIEELKDKSSFSENEILLIKIELQLSLSSLLSYESIYNKNENLDEVTENIIELFLTQKEEIKKLTVSNEKNTESKMFYSLSNIFSEINKFHSMLYFSGYVEYDGVKNLNSEIVKNTNKNMSALISYLKNSTFNDNTFIYDIIKIATVIYADILEGLFVNLSKDEQKINDYIVNQLKYIEKVEKLFIEQYSLLNSSCNNLNKKLTIERK
jgi:hypothetical protein